MGVAMDGSRRHGVVRWAAAVALAVLLGAAGAQARKPKEPKPPKVPEAVTEVTAVVNQFVEALNTCDLEKTMALFAPGATVFSPLTVRPLRAEGLGEVEAVFKELYDNVRKEVPGPRYMNLSPEDLKIQLVGDAAVATFQIAKGPVTTRRTLVLVREGDRWLIAHLHGSNLREAPVPPPPPAAPKE